MISKYKMVSLLTCIIVFSLLVNPVSGILDVPHQSCLFAVSFLSGFIGLLFYVWIVYLVISHKGQDIHSLSTKFVLVAVLLWGLFSYLDQSFPILVIMVIALVEMSNQWPGIYMLKCFPYPHRLLKAGIFVVVFWQGFILVKMYQCHRLLYRTVHCAQGKGHIPQFNHDGCQLGYLGEND